MSCSFGHPSDSVLNKYLEKSSCLNKPCIIYLHAKQTRHVFLLSLNTASEKFDLIHYDIWETYNIVSIFGAKCYLTILDDNYCYVFAC